MQRFFELVCSLLGALAVILVLAFRTSRTQGVCYGPGWWRKLLAGGLTLLGLLGIQGDPAGAENWVKNPNLDQGNGAGDESAPEIDEIARLWDEADAVATNKRGPYPFDQAGKDKLLAELKKAAGQVETLVSRNLLTSPEGELLKLDLGRLAAGVGEMRPTEMQGATCYQPMMFTPVRDSLENLEKRLPNLEKLVSGKVSALVLGKVLEKMELDLKTLSARKDGPNQMEKIDETKAAETEKRVREAIAVIRATSSAGAPSGTKGPDSQPGFSNPEFSQTWNEVSEAFSAQEALLGKPSTEKQRDAEEKERGEAGKALDEMVSKGLLGSDEGTLVKKELEFNQESIRIDPPSDSQVECYEQMYISPMKMTMDRLAQRLPLLGKIVAAGKLNPLVGERVLAALEKDLQSLRESRGSSDATEADLRKSEEMEKEAAGRIDQLKALLGKDK